MNMKYVLGSALVLPLLPIMYWQGKRIRASVPRLPEARGTEGSAGADLDETLRLVTVGESTIAGVGVDTHEEGFTGTLARELASRLRRRVSWQVHAKSGYTAQCLTEKTIPEITCGSADLIVVGLGGNDAFRLNRPGKWRKDIGKLIDALRARFEAAPVVFTNMPPIKEFPAFTPLIRFAVGNLVEILGEELEQVVHDQEGVSYHNKVITLEDWIERLKVDAKPEAFFSDGVHPSKLTYQVWARDMAEFVIQQRVLDWAAPSTT